MLRSLSVMFLRATPEGQAVCLVIGALLIAGLLFVARNFRVMRREDELVAAARRRAHQFGGADLNGLLASAGLDASAADTVIRRGIEGLWRLRRHPELALSALNNLLEVQETRRNQAAQYLATIFLLLGLVGTVLGLGGALLQMVPAVRATEFSPTKVVEIVKGLTGTLGEMQTVFGATLAGLLASILMSGANALYSWYEGRTLGRAEDYLYEIVAPALLPELRAPETAGADLSRSVANLASASAALERASATASGALASTAGQWTETMEAFSNHIDALGHQVATLETEQAALNDAQARVQELLAKVGEREANVQSLLDQLGERLLTAAGAVSETAKTAQAGQDELSAMLQATVSALQRVRDESAEAFKTISSDAEQRLQHLLQQQLSHLDAMRQHTTEHLRQETAAAQDAAARQQRMIEEVGRRLQELIVNETATHGSTHQALLGLIEAVEERTAEALESLPDMSDVVASRLAGAIDSFADAARSIPDSVAAQLAELKASVSRDRGEAEVIRRSPLRPPITTAGDMAVPGRVAREADGDGPYLSADSPEFTVSTPRPADRPALTPQGGAEGTIARLLNLLLRRR